MATIDQVFGLVQTLMGKLDNLAETSNDTNERVARVEEGVKRLNGDVQDNKKRLDKLPCDERGAILVRLNTRADLSQTPREQGRTEATQEAHSVNWQRVVNIVSPIIVTLLLAALIAKP